MTALLLPLAWGVAVGLCVRLLLPPRRRPAHLAPRPKRDAPNGRAVVEAIPDAIDLLAVAVAAGLNVRLAVQAVASRAPPGPVTDALRRAEAETAAGSRLADALERLPDHLGEPARPLARALVDAARYGAPLGASLDRLADDARRARHQRAQEAARRIPIRLLLPLVVCILPAFGLLTVAPLIAGGLRALRL